MAAKFKKDLILFSIFAVITIGLAFLINNLYTRDNSVKIQGTLDIDDSDSKIKWNRYTEQNINLSESLEITKSGIYHLTGSVDDGSVSIRLSQKGEVKLILDNVTIKNNSGPAISCFEGDDLVIELVGENYLSDGEIYDSSFGEDVKGVIYSKADLTFYGDGVLNINANFSDGIVSKDDLKFDGGEYNIVAKDDGIRGKDSVYIVNGNFNIEAAGDAIKSTNEYDYGKGFILIKDGTFNLSTSNGKGLKSINSLLLYGGNIKIDSFDDAIHTNNYIGIFGGNIEITSGDDGIHADKELIVNDGKINILKAYEGLEAQAIVINGGEIDIYSTDDGINAGGGADASANNRPGADAFDVNINCSLTFNGGNIHINASGDGVDSNGYIYFNGGSVIIDGPTNNGNGALDSGAGIAMSGGSVIAIGASGMAESLGEKSSVFSASIYLSSTQQKNTLIEIKNSQDKTIFSLLSAKTFDHIAIGSRDLNFGETYTIYLNNEKYGDFIISGIVTTVGRTDFQNNPEVPQPPKNEHFFQNLPDKR